MTAQALNLVDIQHLMRHCPLCDQTWQQISIMAISLVSQSEPDPEGIRSGRWPLNIPPTLHVLLAVSGLRVSKALLCELPLPAVESCVKY